MSGPVGVVLRWTEIEFFKFQKIISWRRPYWKRYKLGHAFRMAVGFKTYCQDKFWNLRPMPMGNYRWFHRRMPGGNKGDHPLALYHFDIDVHLRESSQHDKLLSFLSVLDHAFCTLADSELIPSTIQPISMRSNNSRKIIPCHLTTDFQGTYDISIEKSISFTLWLTMAVLHQKMRWELRKKFQFVCPCQKLRKFRTGRISVESIGRTCRYPQDIARCKQVCTRFEQKIVNFFLWQRNLRVAFARCFRWASGGIWKTWARTGPLL